MMVRFYRNYLRQNPSQQIAHVLNWHILDIERDFELRRRWYPPGRRTAKIKSSHKVHHDSIYLLRGRHRSSDVRMFVLDGFG
mmetsp:Transcript_514/g.952  ORF Transcript_514/g.952 Transcript_514/m.952 type:complete len:82 (+) Transcript_514:922-1167(+)